MQGHVQAPGSKSKPLVSSADRPILCTKDHGALAPDPDFPPRVRGGVWSEKRQGLWAVPSLYLWHCFKT